MNSRYLAAFILLLCLPGCNNTAGGGSASRRDPPAQPVGASQRPADTSAALFENVTARAGITFRHTNGAEGRFYYIESTPGGGALFDYDNDGFLDIFLVQSGPSVPPKEVAERPHCALYRNNGDGTFTDVTAGSGIDKDLGYGHGVAAGDYDNDGYEDLFVTAVGGNHLLRNERGSGKFADVTAAVGLDKIHDTGFATSAAFGDYDNDGRLDLYVCYYATWTWAKDAACHDANRNRDYCRPEFYQSGTHRLYRNGGRRFADVTEKAGIAKKKGRGLAVAFLDYNEDGRQDIFVANDLEPNMLWSNNGDGTFTDVAVETGSAYAEGGALMAGMGIATADYDHSGRESIFLTNFSGMPKTLFKNVGGLFEDVSTVSGVSLPQMRFLSFGCEFFDYDADGWSDLLVANGHVQTLVANTTEGVTYRQRKQLFHNERNGTFREIADPALLGDMMTPTVARGLAVGDTDNDGRVDALFTNQNDSPQLFRNRDRSSNHWVSFKTVGTRSNRDGRHARFVVEAGGVRQVGTVRAGSSYCSTSDRRVYFGLGAATKLDRVEIRWPSGQKTVLKDVAADAAYIVTEGRGITGKQPVADRAVVQESTG